MLAKMHAQQLSRKHVPWSEERRELRALVAERELYARPLDAHLGRLEAQLAKFWPGIDQVVEVRTRMSIQRWLCEFPTPDLVRAAPQQAEQRLRTLSRDRFDATTRAELIKLASNSAGVRATAQEQRTLRVLLQEIVRLSDACAEVDARIAATLRASEARRSAVTMLSTVTLAVIIAMVGDPSEYGSAQAFEKACGLNLKEHSSGTQQGGIHLTKRGPGVVRRYLFLLAIRMIGRDPIVRAWYQKRRSFQGANKLSAVVAVMRKLTRALWHVAKGAPFDATKLFDVRRLEGLTTGQTSTSAQEVTSAA